LKNKLPNSEIEKIKVELARKLIANKIFSNNRIDGYYTIAIDATGVVSSNKDTFGCGIKKEYKNNKSSYQYYVLEAKLVTENGFSISLGSEWIENEIGQIYDKQDCEQNAFKRLAVQLKKDFPKLPICILADALYATNPMMNICENNNWKYIITLKDKSLKSLQENIKERLKTCENNLIFFPSSTSFNETIKQEFYWIDNLKYMDHQFNYIQCKEVIKNKKTDQSTTTNFVRITNFDVNKTNIKWLCKAGRLRWKIENEGFNTLKNSGYAMQHLFSRSSFNAFKNYYQCMLIAHLINQIVEHTIEIKSMQEVHNKLSIKHLWNQLNAAFKIVKLDPEIIKIIDTKKMQVRLYSG
jgi:hypothetical protein